METSKAFEILLEPKHWEIKRFIDNSPGIHAETKCDMNDDIFISLPLNDKFTIHWHLSPEDYSFDDILSFLDEVQAFYENKSKEIEDAADKLFNKIFNSLFLDKAPPEAISGQIKRWEALNEDADRWHWYHIFILNQEISLLTKVIRGKNIEGETST